MLAGEAPPFPRGDGRPYYPLPHPGVGGGTQYKATHHPWKILSNGSRESIGNNKKPAPEHSVPLVQSLVGSCPPSAFKVV